MPVPVRMTALALAAATAFCGLVAPQMAIAAPPAVPSESSLFTEEFADPSNPNRAMMRLWMPLAPIDEQELRFALTDIADRGFGGVEIGAFPVPGGSAEADGWNSDAWKNEPCARPSTSPGSPASTCVWTSW